MGKPQALVDNVAIVTGAGRNIGREIAMTVAENGAAVAVVDVDEPSARETAASIEDAGGRATPIAVDISDPEQVADMVLATEDAFGPVDVLVNNAAVRESAGFFDLTLDTFDRVLAVNLRGTFLCTREAAKSMRDSGGGRVVNLSSTSGRRGRPTGIAYATSKSGIYNFTRSAARALADYDIRVNTVTPTRTGLSTLGPDEPRDRSAEPQAATDRSIRQEILVGRLGRPRDIASAVLFLVSPESEFVNGIDLLVDGGRSA